MKRIEFKLSDELNNVLKDNSEAVNLNVSEYLRRAITNTIIKPSNDKHFNAIIGQLSKIGNNINQIAHVLNIACKKDELETVDFNMIHVDIKMLIVGIHDHANKAFSDY